MACYYLPLCSNPSAPWRSPIHIPTRADHAELPVANEIRFAWVIQNMALFPFLCCFPSFPFPSHPVHSVLCRGPWACSVLFRLSGESQAYMIRVHCHILFSSSFILGYLKLLTTLPSLQLNSWDEGKLFPSGPEWSSCLESFTLPFSSLKMGWGVSNIGSSRSWSRYLAHASKATSYERSLWTSG